MKLCLLHALLIKWMIPSAYLSSFGSLYHQSSHFFNFRLTFTTWFSCFTQISFFYPPFSSSFLRSYLGLLAFCSLILNLLNLNYWNLGFHLNPPFKAFTLRLICHKTFLIYLSFIGLSQTLANAYPSDHWLFSP